MLEKVKSRIARARTRAVVLEIHNLVESTPFSRHETSFSDLFTGGQTSINNPTEGGCQDDQVIFDCWANTRVPYPHQKVEVCWKPQAVVLGSIRWSTQGSYGVSGYTLG
jgi:hypothetical protein